MRELSHGEMLQALDSRDLKKIFPEQIYDRLRLFQYEKGETLIMAGEFPEYLSVVISGDCSVRPLASDGKEIVLNHLYPGSLMGDIEIVSGLMYIHSVYAETEVIILSVPAGIVKKDLTVHVPFLQYLLKLTTAKLIDHSSYFYTTRMYGSKCRLCKYVVDVADRMNKHEIPFGMSAVATFIGVSERQLRRIVEEYEQRGLILKKGRKLVIKNMEDLRREARGNEAE